MLESILVPSSTTAAAVSSQEVSIPRIFIVVLDIYQTLVEM
jgi:hypothetical protein